MKNTHTHTKKHWHFIQNFPLVPEMTSKIQSDPSPLGYGFFSLNGLRKYAIWVYVDKNLKIGILFRISPQFQKWNRKFNPGSGMFFFKWSKKIRNLSLCRKVFEHWHLFRISLRFQKWHWKFNLTLFDWATIFFFFFKLCEGFWKYFPPIFNGPFFTP